MTMLTIAKTAAAGLETYSVLRKRIRETIAQGEVRAQKAVERENVRTKLEVGKLIQEHILLNKERADYGAKVIRRLSADLGISNTELKYRVQFARTYPMGRAPDQLPWSHIQSLLAINEDDKREELIKRAEKENWTQDRTRSEVKKLKAANQITVTEPPEEKLLTPIKGILDTFRIVTGEAGPWQGRPLVDAGFSNYEELDSAEAGKYREGNIVQLREGTLTLAPNLSGVDIYTYRAYVVEVTDGDTIWMVIDYGFGITKQHLRLRGIDAPEINTREGVEAKAFVERELKKASQILITTTKSDKFDRYLVDIYYETKTGEKFLNNRLLEEKLAVRM